MQLDPLAEVLAYRKICNYILFHGTMSSLQNDYKHLNQAETFFLEESERERVSYVGRGLSTKYAFVDRVGKFHSCCLGDMSCPCQMTPAILQI